MLTVGPWTFPTSGQDDRIMYKEKDCTKKTTAQNLNNYCITWLVDSALGFITFFLWRVYCIAFVCINLSGKVKGRWDSSLKVRNSFHFISNTRVVELYYYSLAS
jgi:hypothetical protein